MSPPEALRQNLPLLLDGFTATLRLAALASLFSLLLGIPLGLLRLSRSRWLNVLPRFLLEAFRVIPLIVWLFLAYFWLPGLCGLELSAEGSAIIVFSLWGASELSDIIRGAIQSLPSHQLESSRALGLDPWQRLRHVILPLGLRRCLPGAVNLLSRLIKTTPLAVIVGVVDLVKRSQQIVERTQSACLFYGLIFLLFFLLCFPLSFAAEKWERRLSH